MTRVSIAITLFPSLSRYYTSLKALFFVLPDPFFLGVLDQDQAHPTPYL